MSNIKSSSRMGASGSSGQRVSFTSSLGKESMKSEGSVLVAQEAVVMRALTAARHRGGLSQSILVQETMLNMRNQNLQQEGNDQTTPEHRLTMLPEKPKKKKWWDCISCRRYCNDDDDDADSVQHHMEDISRNKTSSFSRRALEKIRQQKRPSSVFERLRGSKVIQSEVDVSNFSRMQKLVMEMRDCMFMLEHVDVPDKSLEEWACLVYESMSASSRTFHGVQHVFDMAAEGDEIQKLSAYYHDCIYYNIDGGLSNVQKKYLNDIIVESGDDVFLTQNDLDESMHLVMDIFGFEKGQKLNPFKGLNEYLSAALAVRCFAQFLSPRYLAEISACIEATIPFREGDPMEDLYQRLVKVNNTYSLDMTDAELEVATKRAADFANRDVYNFSLANRAVFLSNTWNLLPESNIKLRHSPVFRISDFALALQKMTGFFSFLKAETIFSSFRNQPSNETIAELESRARENISIALTYMNCKRLSIAVLAAFAELTGGDAPTAMFLGDLPEANYISPSIEDMIKIKKKRKGVELDSRVLSLLTVGRESESEFDIKKSPCAALLYTEIGDQGLKESLKHVVHPMDEKHAKALLLSLPKSCVTDIGLACSQIAITRSQALRALVEKIQHGSTF